jgi:DNA polymerase III epsilon subunit-like protein
MENKIFKDLMVDIETMGNQSYSAILSIAAVEFDINTGETGRTFHKHVNLQSCIDFGLKMQASTVLWWLEQSEEARKAIIDGQKDAESITDVLEDFYRFFEINNLGDRHDYEIWGNSPRFDLGLIQNAFNLYSEKVYGEVKIDIPWNFRRERDVRTLVALKPDIKEKYKFEGTPHNALDDCYFQIGYVCETWKELKN